MEVGLGPGHIVLDGDPASRPEGAQPPSQIFGPCMLYVGQAVGWIKMKLGMKVGLGPGHIVLDGDPAPPKLRGTPAPNFWPMSDVAKPMDGSTCH